MTTYKDLCFDVADPVGAADFLGPLLGLRVGRIDPDVVQLIDDVDAHTVWLNRVPEPRTVKNRVHLDIDVASVDDVLAAGAVVQDDTQPWTVTFHPEVGELCAFVRPPERLRSYRAYELVVDSDDPEAIATWWAAQLGAEVDGAGGAWGVTGGSGPPYELVFVPVPEAKTVKNRVHLDVWGDTAGLLDAGATLLRAQGDGIAWDVLADPEGNEFCVFSPG